MLIFEVRIFFLCQLLIIMFICYKNINFYIIIQLHVSMIFFFNRQHISESLMTLKRIKFRLYNRKSINKKF